MNIRLNTKYLRQESNSLLNMFIFLVIMITSVFSLAQSPAGVVLSVTGQAYLERGEADSNNQIVMQKSSLQKDDTLFVSDRLTTLEDSTLRYELSDDSIYVLQQNSKVVIRKYSYGASQTDTAHIELSAGVMEFVSGNIGKSDVKALRIVTDFAEISLRDSGSIIITTDLNSTQVFVTSGELTGLGVDGELVLLQEGETTIFDATGEPKRYFGNITGAEQTLGEDGSNLLVVDADEPVDLDTESASAIFRSLLSVDPSAQEPTQDQLAQTLNTSINRYPSLYTELITVAIDLGLEPPAAALTVTRFFGSAGNLTEERVADIFLASTAGIADPAEVERAILSVDGAVPVDLNPTDTDEYGQGLRDPIPAVPLDGQAASPAL